mmetsp:Transcript_19123/g.37555  ORF Transcript_19123/g.37555 Transcript_19123/m.37555 type:complete len:206 (-) Transcript_19123:75-692(-)
MAAALEAQPRLPWLREMPPGTLTAVGFAVWAVSFRYSGFDQVYLIFSMLFFILGPGLGHGRGGSRFSAYSVFNEGQRHLLGDLRPEQIDAENRGNIMLERANQEDNAGGGLVDLLEDTDGGETPVVRSRDANRPCQCGSGKKAKRCCFAPPPRPEAAEVTEGAVRPRNLRHATPATDNEPDPMLDRWRCEMTVVDSGQDRPRSKR